MDSLLCPVHAYPVGDPLGCQAVELTEDVAAQLVDELANRLAPHAELDPDMFGGRSPHEAAARVVAAKEPPRGDLVYKVLWPQPTRPLSDWWQTPLGRYCADALADVVDEGDAVTVAEAGRMLGLGHSRVIQLADAGRLERRGDGRITLRTVMHRVAHPGKTGRPGWRTENATP